MKNIVLNMYMTTKVYPIKQVLNIDEIKFPKKNLKDRYCLDPFITANVDLFGNVRLCSCSVWLPTAVGNINDSTIDEILNNEVSHKIRQSIRDGTYEYCDADKCGIINNDRLLKIEEIAQDDAVGELKSTYDRVFDPTVVELPRQITLTGDLICNLSCPSCRTEVITESVEIKAGRKEIISAINKNLFSGSDSRWVTIYLSLGGEVFASPLMLDFLENFPVNRYPRAELKFQTNGLLIKKRWDRISHLKKNIFNITITADSQDPDTYEKLRRGGKYSTLIENLEFVSQQKKDLGFEFVLRMIVQKDNALEIDKFFDFAMKYNVVIVEYQFLQNQTFTKEEYLTLDVMRPDHELHDHVIATLRKLRDLHGSKVIIYHGSI